MNGQTIIALLAVYIFWGATFLAMRVAVETIPPMVLVCLRFVLVAPLMLGWAYFKEGAWKIEKNQWKGLILTGVGLFTIGNGAYAIALQYIPSSLATLIGATGVVWMVLLDWYFRGKKPTKVLMIGLFVSMVGVFVLVGKPETGGVNLIWLLVCMVASFSWTLGTYGSSMMTMPKSIWQTVGWQNLIGGIGGGLLGILTGDWWKFHPSLVNAESWGGVAYLVCLGSIIGFTSYQWVVTRVSPVIASTTALVTPVTAMFFGWLILNEPFTIRTFIAFFLVLSGVVALIRGRSAKKE